MKTLFELRNWIIGKKNVTREEILDIPVNLPQVIISVKLLLKWCQLVGIVTSLLHANYV